MMINSPFSRSLIALLTALIGLIILFQFLILPAKTALNDNLTAFERQTRLKARYENLLASKDDMEEFISSYQAFSKAGIYQERDRSSLQAKFQSDLQTIFQRVAVDVNSFNSANFAEDLVPIKIGFEIQFQATSQQLSRLIKAVNLHDKYIFWDRVNISAQTERSGVEPVMSVSAMIYGFGELKTEEEEEA